MIKEQLEEAIAQGNIRGALSGLRQEIKQDDALVYECASDANVTLLLDLLSHEDAKTRKNAVLLLGDICEDVSDTNEELVVNHIYEAYQTESKLFVKSSYLKAMKMYDCKQYQEELQKRLDIICQETFEESDMKHIREERRELEEILQKLLQGDRHMFTGLDCFYDILLVSDKCIREHLAKQIGNTARVVPFGVRVKTDDLSEVVNNPLYRQMLFFVSMPKGAVITKDNAGTLIPQSGLLAFLNAVHNDVNQPFYFRLEMKGKIDREEQRNLLKKISYEIEENSEHQLVNSPGDYEVEIRLMQRKDGTFALFAKLLTIADERFTYREHIEPTSLHPVAAAEIVELASEFLQDDAQIIDPFCGVGTLLIERNKKIPAKEVYGLDIYGSAIRGARENTQRAGEQFNYINRDYFDFTHEYLFDEVISDFPIMYKSDREEIDEFYRNFFRKTNEITTESAVLILYTNEEGQMKKHLRLNPQFQLVRQIEMSKKEILFVIRKK